ncbi:P-loop containing nucleoside triphosphate hydrolase protein [Aspergillus stella-maris]|uniref:P-loop containing nucleoside triphosphate hydrolase protein n=1 Tax=Aspergillus stella-maris TaxID=1810926 RepID=UPI003CCD127A
MRAYLTAADDSQASDNDGGERPVRKQLKETSITSVPKTSTETSNSRASSRGRKRSHDDDEEENMEDESGHRRKRSRDSNTEEAEAITTKPDAIQPEQSQPQVTGVTLKKKRSRDQVDKEEPKCEDSAEKAGIKNTSERAAPTQKAAAEGEPEKKRHRDESRERESAPLTSAFANTSSVSPFGAIGTSTSKPAEEAKQTTSSSAFASSSLAAFASSEQSPFGSLGASTPSVFKSSESTPVGSDSPAATGFASTKPSGFAALGSGFSGFSGGFGGASSGGLTSFAAPGAPSALGSTSSKPFGAEADSDNEDKEDQGESGPGEFESDKTDERFFERQIETGEEEEKTYFACKAKLFHFSDKEWRERGLGNFKVNVKIVDGVEDKKSARMVMRADGVLRVMLNTALFKGMKVGDAAGNEPRSKQVHLASFEGNRSVPLLLRRPVTSKASTETNTPSTEAGINDSTVKQETTEPVPNPNTDSSQTTSTGKPAKKPRKTPVTKKQKGKDKDKEEDEKQAPRKPTTPWPDSFKKLSRIHRALNLVYTFCCTRKHFATTFDNIKKAVAAQSGAELTVEDIARIKVFIPRAIRLEYVDEASLDVLSAGEKEEVRGLGKDGWVPKYGNGVEIGDVSQVLLFEFLDGDLKRERKANGPASASVKDRDEDMKMPVFSQKQMLTLIEKRNGKFADAVDAALVRCEDEALDPELWLESEKNAFIPVLPEDEGVGAGSKSGVVGRGASSKVKGPIPKDRKTMAEIIDDIRCLNWYTGQIVPDGHRAFDAQPPVYGDLKFALSQDLVNALYNQKGISQFYSHQAEAMNHLHDGHNVIVSTSTSSGKSLIYQIPMLHELEQDPNSRGMYIFPTKALAQDQKRSMQELLQYLDGLQCTMVETFDGDTPTDNRNFIRDEARIIFTNPDMLHITILPQESSWRSFLQNLKFVVVDELHVYNGLFGSHVALIMRRLRRICAAVGNKSVRFISCSATVANPEEHMQAIFGVDDVKLVDFDGSPCGRKEFLCWNTPFKDPTDPTSGRGDAVAEAARLFCQLILRGARVIAFCRIRKLCEVLLQAVKTECTRLERGEVGSMIMGYRGGYSPQDRRKIEAEMFQGQLLGIVATNALELGVDIGSLDAVITFGFPYSISNLRQQSGRAGRRNKDSLSVLIGDRYPTDQYYMRNPEELFSKPNCELQVDLANELVLEGHIQCAAFELPIAPDTDSIYFGPQLAHFASTRLKKDAMGYYHCHERFRPHPSRCVPIRDTEDQHFAVIDTTNSRNMVLEEVEASRAFFTLYEGGIFLHQGQTYLVKELNPDAFFARVVRVTVDWNTMQRDFTDIDPIETEHTYFGPIRITAIVYGFFKIDKRGRILDAVPVDNPPITLFTKGLWLDVPKVALDILESHRLNIAAAIHAAEHAVLSQLPSFVVSSPGDVRTECKVAKKELGSELRKRAVLKPPARQRPARLTFYDAKGGSCGSGIARKAFEFIDTLLIRAVNRIENCVCVTPGGCLECCCDERCKEMNSVMSKAGAGVVLRCLLGWGVDVEGLPWGEDVGEGEEGMGELVGGYETVVLAREVPRAGGS